MVQCRVLLPSLDPTHVGAGDAGLKGKRLLRHTATQAKFAHAMPERSPVGGVRRSRPSRHDRDAPRPTSMKPRSIEVIGRRVCCMGCWACWMQCVYDSDLCDTARTSDPDLPNLR